jgi:hypothetical protein
MFFAKLSSVWSRRLMLLIIALAFALFVGCGETMPTTVTAASPTSIDQPVVTPIAATQATPVTFPAPATARQPVSVCEFSNPAAFSATHENFVRGQINHTRNPLPVHESQLIQYLNTALVLTGAQPQWFDTGPQHQIYVRLNTEGQRVSGREMIFELSFTPGAWCRDRNAYAPAIFSVDQPLHGVDNRDLAAGCRTRDFSVDMVSRPWVLRVRRCPNGITIAHDVDTGVLVLMRNPHRRVTKVIGETTPWLSPVDAVKILGDWEASSTPAM